MNAIGALSRTLRYLSIAIAAHGCLFAVLALGVVACFGGNEPEALGSFAFYFLYIPASALAKPFSSILWRLRLMEAPGWFAGPKPLGFVIVYALWVVGLLVLSFVVTRFAARKPS